MFVSLIDLGERRFYFTRIYLNVKKVFLVLQKFCDGFSGRVSHLSKNNIRQSKKSSLYPNAYFFLLLNMFRERNSTELKRKTKTRMIKSNLPRHLYCHDHNFVQSRPQSPRYPCPAKRGTRDSRIKQFWITRFLFFWYNCTSVACWRFCN